MRASALLCALLLAPASARAGLVFMQVSQAQTSRGEDGMFGKSWVEVSGGRMRIVSGYARRLDVDGDAEDPQRLIQIVDLARRERILVYPETKTFSKASLETFDYAEGLENKLKRGAPDRRLELKGLKLQKRPGVRRLLEADCERYRLSAELLLSTPGGPGVAAQLNLDVWVAPISGHLSQTLLELISFENAYRGATGGALSPLDHERYQVREAAAYLQVPAAELQRVVGEVRSRLRDLPSYPVALSVGWWRDASEGEAPRLPKAVEAPVLKPQAPVPPLSRKGGKPKPAFRPIDWRRSEKDINTMYERTRSQWGDFAFGPLPKVSETPSPAPSRTPERSVYPAFRDDLQRALVVLLGQLAEGEPARQASSPAQAEEAGRTPFYQIYTQLHGLEAARPVSEGDLAVPAGYTEKPPR